MLFFEIADFNYIQEQGTVIVYKAEEAQVILIWIFPGNWF